MSTDQKSPQKMPSNDKSSVGAKAVPAPSNSPVSSWLLLGGIGVGVLAVLVTGVVIGLALEGFAPAADESVAQNERPANPTPPAPTNQPAPVAEKPVPETDTEPTPVGPEAIPVPALVVEEKKPEPEPAPVVKPDPAPPKPVVSDIPDPKRFTGSIRTGLDYLAKSQLANGGWPAGAAGIGPMIGVRPGVAQPQPKPPAEQADLGPTCIATLALLRSGSTPAEGPHAKNVAKAVEYILFKVERSDSRSLLINDLKQTQLQHKIGPYVDTFLTLMVLAELKGRMGSDKGEQRVLAALQKTITKVEGNVKADGTFANNNGWASVLSQGLAIKGLNRARQAGAKVSDAALDRLQKHALAELEQKLKAANQLGGFVRPGKGGPAVMTPPPGSSDSAAPTDAGVALYSLSANLAGLREAVSTNQEREKKARAVLDDENASNEQKAKARTELARLQEARKSLDKAVDTVAAQGQDPRFLKGVGSNGGEEFLSFMNIGETLLLKGGDSWSKWDKTITTLIEEAQDKEGSWSGHHCITGKTFCTATALLTLLADRSQTAVAGTTRPDGSK